MGEVSSISKKDGQLWAHAKDPISAGLSLEALTPPNHWENHPEAVALCLGAGGSAIAISWYLTRAERGQRHPAGIVVTNRSQPRLTALEAILDSTNPGVPVTVYHCPTPQDNDRVVATAPAGSLVINASGLGKDAPGSPLSNDVQFPLNGLVWDLNYRGELIFLDQAQSQKENKRLAITDGWVYFLHGWTQVIQEVFQLHIPPAGKLLDELSQIALEVRS